MQKHVDFALPVHVTVLGKQVPGTLLEVLGL